MNSIAIIGTGAIGGFYGALLVKAGYEVHFLINSDYEYVKRNGLKVESPLGNFSLNKVNSWHLANKMPKCDLVIITLKTTANHLLKDILPSICHSKSKVLVLQNGLDTEDDASNIVPKNEIFGGLCAVACNKIGPGHIKHIAYNQIRLGQYIQGKNEVGITQSLKEVSAILNNAEISTILDKSIAEARWRKLVWNMTFNGLCTVLDCSTKEIMNNSNSRKRATLIMTEVVSAANSCGMSIELEYIDKMLELTDNMEPYFPSMKVDYDNKRPLEFDAIYQKPINKAKANNCEIPNIKTLADEIQQLIKDRK